MTDIGYLDVCCFKRPFDDATQDRVRREAEAVAAVLDAAARGSIRLVRSPAHDLENDRNAREDRRLATELWLPAGVQVGASQHSASRARELALHLAFAEQSGAAWFATTDDRLLTRARAHRLRVRVLTPDEVPLADPPGGAT